jgi:ribose/xylose/arabinose/galactoside ABC-type transport system permease subunit
MYKLLGNLLDNLIWIILLLTVCLFSVLTDKFLTINNIINIFVHASVLGILVIAQSFVLITGNFDLSIESILGFTAMLAAWLMVEPQYGGSGLRLHPIFAIIIMLATGVMVGALNGFLITKMNMNNFIVTLSMLIILRGLTYVLTYGKTLINTPKLFNFLGGGNIGQIPVSVIILILSFLVAHLIINYYPFGRALYAIGGNKEAAFASGIDPDKVIRKVYMISGGLAAFAAWIQAGRLESVTAKLGEGMVFEVFAAAVIGGISLQGGRGHMLGAFGGVLLLSTIDAGLNLMQVSPFWINVIRGFIILIAMLIDAQKTRYRIAAYRSLSVSPLALYVSKENIK